MSLNKSQKTKFESYTRAHIMQLKTSPFLKTGVNRNIEAKEANYTEVKSYLSDLRLNTQKSDIDDAVAIIKAVLGRELEVQEPPADNGAARKLQALNRDSTAVTLVQNGINVRLDIDQLKHQHPSNPIGTRQKGGGNRFIAQCDIAWHQANTLTHMADWAVGLGAMAVGEQKFHGQARPVNDIHYEGYCLNTAAGKYVLFHCYPSNDSDLLM